MLTNIIDFKSIMIAFFVAAFVGIDTTTAATNYNGAVILAYHRFGEDSFPSTNIKLDQFEEHIEELINGKYNVVPLHSIVKAIRYGGQLPDRTIAITIDDAYLSVYTEAWPRLKAANLPFTVFVSTAAVDQNRKGIMNWQQIRELHESGVTIGNHTVGHRHLTKLDAETAKREIVEAQARFEAELGVLPTLLAYPYGEASNALISSARSLGFAAAFGQHSGVASGWLERFYLPRFPFNERYGHMDRFRLAVNALALPVKDMTPSNPLLEENPPIFGFSVTNKDVQLNQIMCFVSNQTTPAKVEVLGNSRVEVRIADPFSAKRGRINCTLPASKDRWHWFGMQYVLPE